MTWTEVYNKYNIRYCSELLQNDEVIDRNYIIDIILDTFPFYSRQHVEAAVDYCSGKLGTLQKQDILDYVSRVL